MQTLSISNYAPRCTAPASCRDGESPLRLALDWWASRDGMGGFATAAATLFPGWTPRRTGRAPHRPDRTPSFSLYRNTRGLWRFKDHATGEQGGLVDFVMLAGMTQSDACKWVMEHAPRNDEIRMTKPERMTNDPMTKSNAHASFQPHQLTDVEQRRCAAISTSLAGDPSAILRFAVARDWKLDTIRSLALDGSLGIDGERMVMIYPTGAKKRLKPLESARGAEWHGAKFAWMFGKPHSLWRANRITDDITPATQRIHITEGETDAINLIDAGCEQSPREIVVAVPGASCWRDEWAAQFHGKRVTLWPDPDEAGQRLAQRIITSLANIASAIEIAQLFSAPLAH